jgi:hypothetical protein
MARVIKNAKVCVEKLGYYVVRILDIFHKVMWLSCLLKYLGRKLR